MCSNIDFKRKAVHVMKRLTATVDIEGPRNLRLGAKPQHAIDQSLVRLAGDIRWKGLEYAKRRDTRGW